MEILLQAQCKTVPNQVIMLCFLLRSQAQGAIIILARLAKRILLLSNQACKRAHIVYAVVRRTS
jgi:hypothetical protein